MCENYISAVVGLLVLVFKGSPQNFGEFQGFPVSHNYLFGTLACHNLIYLLCLVLVTLGNYRSNSNLIMYSVCFILNPTVGPDAVGQEQLLYPDVILTSVSTTTHPPTASTNHQLPLPGQQYAKEQQCQLRYGPSASSCEKVTLINHHCMWYIPNGKFIPF